MKYLVCSVVIFALALSGVSALRCYECSGSEMSDCAKGVKSAGVPVKCEVPDYSTPGTIPPNAGAASSSEETTPEMDGTTTESHYDKLKRLGCYEPIKVYPACVTYSMQPYNGIEGQNLVYRSCMLTSEDFCKSHLQYNKNSMCHSCNSTDFCM